MTFNKYFRNVLTHADVDALAVDAMRRLIWKLSDCNLDVGALEITEMIFREASGGGKDKGCQKQSASMARMLAESLKVNDPAFLKVSQAVVFISDCRYKLAGLELRRVGL